MKKNKKEVVVKKEDFDRALYHTMQSPRIKRKDTKKKKP